jgi:hypothetical protein
MQRPTLIPHILSAVTSDGTIDQEVEALEAAIIAMAEEIEVESTPVKEMPPEEKKVAEIPDEEPIAATSEPVEENEETPEVIPGVTEDVAEVKIPPTIEMAVEELAASFSGSGPEHELEVGVEPRLEATSAPESKSKSIPDSADEYVSMDAPQYESKGEPAADVTASGDAGTGGDDWSIFSSAMEDFVEIIGLDDDLSGDWPSELPGLRRALSPYVGLAPRDTRIDRLLRLVLRAIPPNDAGRDDIEKSVLVIVKLSEFARKLSAWSRERLLYRNLSSSGALLADGEALGLALERIPGPGIAIPLEADDISLPRFEDYDDLLRQVEKLKGAINLPTAGNIVAASA